MNKVLLESTDISMIIDAILSYKRELAKGDLRLAVKDYERLIDEINCQCFDYNRNNLIEVK
jgi:hypothetical protein